MSSKQALGQFFTTNADYILQGFGPLVKDKAVVDPFAGNCDLLNWAKQHGAKSTKGYDIDTKYITKIVSSNDSLINIPSANFNLTNPPYLAKNKMPVSMKRKYMVHEGIDDLYQLAIKRIIEANCSEGIIIVPLNFFSAENSETIRKDFFAAYDIGRINLFTEQVFSDTTYNVVAFHYFKNTSRNKTLNIHIYPENKKVSITVEREFGYTIGGKDINDILSCKNRLQVKRLTHAMMLENKGSNSIDGYFNDYNDIQSYKVSERFRNVLANNIITFECIDGKRDDDKIRATDMRFKKPSFVVGKHTSRNIASVIIDNCSIDLQAKLIQLFNQELHELRQKYHSLFLTNFRDNNRKRISFDFCYKLLNYCYCNLLSYSKNPST